MFRFFETMKLATLALLIFTGAAMCAEQRFTVREDGLVRFKVSVTGITRLSVVGDRIADIISDNDVSAYQAKGDEKTGDRFLRYVGQDEKPRKEGGYLITEKGRTIAFEILPIQATTQTILITVKPNEARADEITRSESFADSSLGSGDGLVSALTAATRETIHKGIRTPKPKSGKNGALVRSIGVGDLVGEVRVAAAGKSARQIREQEFYTSGVLSVWVQKASLAAGERSWVVVVRNK